MDMAKMAWGEKFEDTDLGEIQDLINTTPEKLTEDNLMEMSASVPMPDVEKEDIEEAVPKNKLTSDNLADGFQLFKTTFDLFL